MRNERIGHTFLVNRWLSSVDTCGTGPPQACSCRGGGGAEGKFRFRGQLLL